MRRPPHRWRATLLLAALLGAAALPGAPAGSSFSDSARATNFRIAPAKGTARACFTLAADASCEVAGPCCLQDGAAISRLLLLTNNFNPACSSSSALSAVVITVNGQTVIAWSAKVKGRSAVAVPLSGAANGPVSLCVDPSGIAGCSSIGQLCGGRLCSFSLSARGARQGSGQQVGCSINAVAEHGDPTAEPSFKIQLVKSNPAHPQSAALGALFASVAGIWEDALNVQMPPYALGSGEEWMPGHGEALNGSLLVFYEARRLDDQGRSLGRTILLKARPRPGGGKQRVPLAAWVQVDEADLPAKPQEEWAAILLHELGHALGVGLLNLWYERGCLHECPLTFPGGGGGGGVPLSYECKAARGAYRGLGCGKDLGLESGRGPGQDCVHFRETELPDELMTPYVGRGALSRVTLGAVEDIWGAGSVNYGAAAPWACGGAQTAAPGSAQVVLGPGSPEPEEGFELVQPDW